MSRAAERKIVILDWDRRIKRRLVLFGYVTESLKG